MLRRGGRTSNMHSIRAHRDRGHIRRKGRKHKEDISNTSSHKVISSSSIRADRAPQYRRTLLRSRLDRYPRTLGKLGRRDTHPLLDHLPLRPLILRRGVLDTLLGLGLDTALRYQPDQRRRCIPVQLRLLKAILRDLILLLDLRATLRILAVAVIRLLRHRTVDLRSRTMHRSLLGLNPCDPRRQDTLVSRGPRSKHLTRISTLLTIRMARQLLIPARRTILRESCLLQRLRGQPSLPGRWRHSTRRTSRRLARLISLPDLLANRSPLLNRPAIIRARRPLEALRIPPLARPFPRAGLTPATFTMANSRNPFQARVIRLSRACTTTPITRSSHKDRGLPAGGRLQCHTVRRLDFSIPVIFLRVSVAHYRTGKSATADLRAAAVWGPQFPHCGAAALEPARVSDEFVG
jgi:hypothetical protein